MNRDDVIDVLSVVAAATRRTVGETDVDIWQAVIGDLPKEIALRAVRDHLREKPGIWLEPGHIYERVRAIRRDQLDREPDSAREARQEALAAKAAEDIEELAERKGIQHLPTRHFQRPQTNYLAVRCPFEGCRAAEGQQCANRRTGDRPAGGVHPSRIEAADALTNGVHR